MSAADPPAVPAPRSTRRVLAASVVALLLGAVTGVGGLLGVITGVLAVRALRARAGGPAVVAVVLSALAVLPAALLLVAAAVDSLPSEQRYQACVERSAPGVVCQEPLTGWLHRR